jgi:hypothetical protein
VRSRSRPSSSAIQRRVVAGPDEAPVARIHRRVVDDRARDERGHVGERIDRQLALREERRLELRDRREKRGRRLKAPPERHEVPRRGAPGGHARVDPLHVGQLPEPLPERRAQRPLREKLLYRIQTPRDGIGPEQGVEDPAAQRPGAHRAHRAIEHAEERSVAAPLPKRLRELEVAPRGVVQHHVIGESVGNEPREMAHRGHLRGAGIFHQRPGGAYRRVEVAASEALERRDAKLLVKERLGVRPVEATALDHVYAAPLEHPPPPGKPLGGREVFGHKHLARVDPRDLFRGRPLVLHLGGAKLTRGEIQVCDSEAPAARRKAEEKIVPARVQVLFFEKRSRRDHPRDLAAHQTLREPRILHLVAHDDLVTQGDEARDVASHRMVGNTAEWHGVGALLVARGKGDIKKLGRAHRVLEEHLVEVPHPVQHDLLRVAVLELQVVPEHGRRGRRGTALGPGRGSAHEGRFGHGTNLKTT